MLGSLIIVYLYISPMILDGGKLCRNVINYDRYSHDAEDPCYREFRSEKLSVGKNFTFEQLAPTARRFAIQIWHL